MAKLANPVIISDSREKFPYNLEWYGLDVTHSKVRTGDYSIIGKEDYISIDRKASVSELVGNLFYDYTRFKKECIRSMEIKYFFLVLEFPLELIMLFPLGSNIPKSKWKYLRASPESILKKLKILYESYGVRTVFNSNRLEAEERTVEILNKVINDESLEDIEYYRG